MLSLPDGSVTVRLSVASPPRVAVPGLYEKLQPPTLLMSNALAPPGAMGWTASDRVGFEARDLASARVTHKTDRGIHDVESLTGG